jgi:FkbM family methyltransferase
VATFFSEALRRVVLISPLAPVARRLADAARRDIYRDARRRLLIDEEIVPMLEPGFDPATWVIKQTAFGFRIWCSLDERAISRPIMLDVYEHAESRFIERTVKPGDLAVDVGANIGYHALHLAKLTGPQGCVEAFEPLRALADVLERSRDENGFTARMTVHHLALDEVAGELRLRHAPRTSNFGGAHLSADDVVPPDHVDVTVRTARLDDVVGERTCRFIKIERGGGGAARDARCAGDARAVQAAHPLRTPRRATAHRQRVVRDRFHRADGGERLPVCAPQCGRDGG